jgi:RNA polymerase sigma factor (sigma-70 family)
MRRRRPGDAPGRLDVSRPGPGYRGRSPEWLRGILRNRIGRLHRRYVTASRRSVRLEQPLGALDVPTEAGPADSTEVPVLRGELAATVDRAVARLRPRERDILAWRLNDGLPWHEIAEHLQVTTDAARKVFTRALSRLRGQLPRHLDPGDP